MRNVGIILVHFLNYRTNHGVNVVHISDIYTKDEKPQEQFWSFDMLKEHMRNKSISLVRFGFLGLQVTYKAVKVVNNIADPLMRRGIKDKLFDT